VCGFIGKISRDNINHELLIDSNKNIICRGPDETKTLIENTNYLFHEKTDLNLSLIFNRLSIIDLTEKASQPMVSKDFQSLILFNGEIYNHQKLRTELELEGIKFNSNHSDTEVALLGISHEGINFINKLEGQFSIFFYSNKMNKAYLVRDRLGQKPMYYNTTKQGLIFSSNLLSLAKNVEKKTISTESLNLYLQLGAIPSPRTIFDKIYKVEPGEILEYDFQSHNFIAKSVKYWNIEEHLDNKRFSKDIFFDLFTDSITKRLNSDVPIANFLSGGIDSTAIVKNLNDNGHKINTFSVSYDGDAYDESLWFDQVANKYSTNQEIRSIDISNLTTEVDDALNAFDEPYADPSVVPSFLLSKLISEKFKVAISGDGGDELLAGYRRINETMSRNKNLSFLSTIFSVYPSFLGTGNNFLKHSKNTTKAYSSYFEDNKLLNLMGVENKNSYIDSIMPNISNDYKRIMISEYKFFLSEMMMMKIDRTSMANSLEVRSPFVDHKLVEYMLSVDSSKINFNNSKQILKDYLQEDFDSDFTNRKKMGFVFDVQRWVYNNKELISETINNSKYIKEHNKNLIFTLSINKSRINAQRIWKIFVLAKYLERI
jgi:asparagine synthase (glutamine-hydrolysing)